MKLLIIKSCQPNTQPYEAGKVYEVSGVDANHLLTHKLAERVVTQEISFTEKVNELTKKKAAKPKTSVTKKTKTKSSKSKTTKS